jgi:transmembrane sensor
MDHKHMHRLLARKMAGELSEQEAKELEELYSRDPESLYNMELLMQLWQQEGPNDVEDSFARHRSKFKEEFEWQPLADAEENKPSSRWKRRLVPVFAGVLSAVALVQFVVIPTLTKKDVEVSAPRQVAAAKGRKQKIVLPDNTQVWLNADSKLSYDDNMNNGKTRTVYLTGEAFFDVTKRPDQPFIIHTSKISIKVLGTAFNVKAYPGDKITETTLIRGMVELSVNARPEKKIILKPNEKFALIDSTFSGRTAKANDHRADNNSQQMIVASVEPLVVADKEYLEEISWVDNMLVFKNETMQELLPKLERWYDIKIELENEAVKNYHYTGVFENESVKDALDAMSLIRPFNYKINTSNNSVTIY